MTSFNAVDIGILAIFFISAFAGLMRGFVKEFLSLLTWIVAIIVASKFSKPLAASFSSADVVQTSMGSTGDYISWLAIGVSFAVLFAATMIVGAIFNLFITRAVESGGISVINRMLGGVFGLARGYLINLVLIFLLSLTPFAQNSLWTDSQFVRFFQPAVAWIGEQVQPGFDSLKATMGETLRNMNFEGMTDSIKNLYPGSH